MNRYNIYEIYLSDMITGEKGAFLKSIIAFNRDDAATYPFFDEVVMYEGTMGNNQDAVRESGLPLTQAVSASLRAQGDTTALPMLKRGFCCSIFIIHNTKGTTQ